MTEFQGKNTGKVITTHNNMNNICQGDYIEVDKDNNKDVIKGIVESISHYVSAWHNREGKERSTHDLIIVIND